MSDLIQEREGALSRRLALMRQLDEWHLFQNFVLGLLRHDGYTDVRPSAVRGDFGRDAVAKMPDGKKCFVAVSFDCTLAKILHDAKRWCEDPNREDAEVMLFVANDSPQNTKVSKWQAKIKTDYGLELRLFNGETILSTATSLGVWQDTCARLGIVGHRQGYTKVSPYDTELVQRALKARPPEWLRQRVPLPQWGELTAELRNRFIIGKPGAGKTTTIFEQLERARPDTVLVIESDLSDASQIEGLLDEAADGAVMVFDDLHDNPKSFVSLCLGWRTRMLDAPKIAERYENVFMLAGTRSYEWESVRAEVPDTVLHDLSLLGDGEMILTGLDQDGCGRLIEICRDEWELGIEERLLKQAAEAAAQRDATPLYVISMLAEVRGREGRTLKDADLAGLPDDVRALWARYWTRLGATSQGVLRLIRLFWAAKTPPHPQLLQTAADVFGVSPVELSGTLDLLERSLWLTRTAGVPACLDVQYEAIELNPSWYKLWDRFVFGLAEGYETQIQLHNGTGGFYSQGVAPQVEDRETYRTRLIDAAAHCDAVVTLSRGRSDKMRISMGCSNTSVIYSTVATLETCHEGRQLWLAKAVKAVEESIAIQRKLGHRGDLSAVLNNASNRYIALADLKTTRRDRLSWLGKAVDVVEESIAIRRELGLRGDLARSLSTAWIPYSELEKLETTSKGRLCWLDKAVKAVEESTGIFRKLGLRGDLALSLINAATQYLGLASLETMPAGQLSWQGKGVDAVEEAIAICRELGQRGILAAGLNNASNQYSAMAGLETTHEGRLSWLGKAVKAVEESIAIYRKLGLRGELAISLGSLCNHQRSLSQAELDPTEAKRRLDLAGEAIDEALELFRDAGNTPCLLLSLQAAVGARLMQAGAGEQLNLGELGELILEGLGLANSMRDDAAIAFFTPIQRKFTELGDV